MWEPFETVVVSTEAEYGDVVSCPYMTPSRRNSTLVTPTLSVALTVSVIVPLTVAPFVGAVAATVGATVSAAAFETVTVTLAAVPMLPAAS